ncbi:MAG: DUF4911 domain-containing protein [Syntrophorhabdaceae bacterium]|nr:DUF4911 domain-containing protein [Syntrophorhabdaceae bacterium]
MTEGEPGRKGAVMIAEKTKRFLVDREGIGFFKSVLESYEDVAIFSVIDGQRGIIEIIYSSGFEEDVRGIVADMANYGIEFREVSDVQ